MGPLILLDFAGVAVFAATGALAASRKQLDLVGFLFLATVTGIGGGTLRDLVLGVPVFWIEQHLYILVCAAMSFCVFLAAHMVESRYRLLLWLDAVGLAAYGVFGAYKGLLVTGSPVIAIVSGVLTATFGGILRDLLSNEPSVLLRPEIYVTAALAGAVAFVVLFLAGAPLVIAALVAFVAAFAIRGGALRFGWRIATYKGRPGRRPPDI